MQGSVDQNKCFCFQHPTYTVIICIGENARCWKFFLVELQIFGSASCQVELFCTIYFHTIGTRHKFSIAILNLFCYLLCKAGYISGFMSGFLLIQIFLFSDKVCDISKSYNFLTMHVVYLSIQFSDNACDISVNPFLANEWDICDLIWF